MSDLLWNSLGQVHTAAGHLLGRVLCACEVSSCDMGSQLESSHGISSDTVRAGHAMQKLSVLSG